MSPANVQNIAAGKERALVALLLRMWDPIGVQPGVGAPANEYDSYVSGVLSILQSGGNATTLAAFLADVRAKKMAMGEHPRRDHAVALAIIEAVELLESKVSGPAT